MRPYNSSTNAVSAASFASFIMMLSVFLKADAFPGTCHRSPFSTQWQLEKFNYNTKSSVYYLLDSYTKSWFPIKALNERVSSGDDGSPPHRRRRRRQQKNNEQIRNKTNNYNSAITRNKKISELGRQRKWKDILTLYHNEKENFNNVNYATMMSQLGRIRNVNRQDPLFLIFLKELANIMERKGLGWMYVRQTANIIHAIGKMKLRCKDSNRIIDLVSKKENALWLVKEGKAQEVANTAWAFATLDRNSPELFSAIEKRATWLVKEGKPQEVANTAWAFAKVGINSEKLFEEVENCADWLISEAKTQEVSNTVWAFATLGIKSSPILSGIEKRSEWLVKEGKPQEVANTAWAFATLDTASKTLFAEIEKRADWLVKNGKPQEVANTAWAYAILGVDLRIGGGDPPRLFTEIRNESNRLVRDGKHQEVSNLAWACGALKVEVPELFGAIEERAEWLVNEGTTPQTMSNTLWAASQFRYYMPALAAAVDKKSQFIVSAGNSQAIANTALGFATMGYETSYFFQALENNVEALLKFGKPQEISNTCYSLVVLDLAIKHKTFLSTMWSKLLKMDPEGNVELLNQVHQIKLYSNVDGIYLEEPSLTFQAEMKNAKVDDMTSWSQKQISSLLTEIGFSHDEEVSPLFDGVEGGMLSIDMACRKRRIAIEYDGPTHYLVSVPNGNIMKKEDGTTIAKRRFLSKSGWKVVNLDYRDHLKYRDNRERQIEWLKKELVSSLRKSAEGKMEKQEEKLSVDPKDVHVANACWSIQEESPPELNQEDTIDWFKLTVVQLKDELRNRGLKVSGRKAELVERLLESTAP